MSCDKVQQNHIQCYSCMRRFMYKERRVLKLTVPEVPHHRKLNLTDAIRQCDGRMLLHANIRSLIKYFVLASVQIIN